METTDEYLMQPHIKRHQPYHLKCEYFQVLNGSKSNTFRLQTRQQTPNWWDKQPLPLSICMLHPETVNELSGLHSGTRSIKHRAAAGCPDGARWHPPERSSWSFLNWHGKWGACVQPSTFKSGQQQQSTAPDPSWALLAFVFTRTLYFSLFHQCLCCTFPGFQFCFFSSDCFYSFALTHTSFHCSGVITDTLWLTHSWAAHLFEEEWSSVCSYPVSYTHKHTHTFSQWV